MPASIRAPPLNITTGIVCFSTCSANRRETAESNIYGMAAGIQIVNPLALESEKVCMLERIMFPLQVHKIGV